MMKRKKKMSRSEQAASSEQLSGRSEQLSGRPEQLTGASEQLSGATEQLSGALEQLSGATEQLSDASDQSLEQQVDEKKKSTGQLAAQIMKYARDEMMVVLRFLNRAFYRMPMVESEEIDGFAVDGEKIYFGSPYVLRQFRQQKERIPRAFLHMVFHCIYCHPFRYETLQKEYWNLATDLAVEDSILNLGLSGVAIEGDEERKKILKKLREATTYVTAEILYRYFLDHPQEAQEYQVYASLFFQDLHEHWLITAENVQGEKESSTMYMEAQTGQVGCHEADEPSEDGEPTDEVLVGQSQDTWKDLAVAAQTEIAIFSKGQGLNANSIEQNLMEVLRDKYDYSKFLKKFSVMGEEMHINDEEFDYVYYTYGMKLYENMPLIEPLEYRESKRIRDFVIAIDTSGSCSGKTVERFLQKTYSILKSGDSFFKKVNIHIIQCDAEIQADVKITSDEEFEAYMKEVTLSGFGGTDFRPVFDYVDGMVRRHEFQDLKGLIYFTDGKGEFPKKRPKYTTAFVFVEEGFEIPQVPAWAVKLVLRPDEI